MMLFYPDRITPYLLLIPVIAAVQYIFTLGDRASSSRPATSSSATWATSSRHVLRLWWYLSPGLYSLAALESSTSSRSTRSCAPSPMLNPFAILFEAYRSVIYGTADEPARRRPNWGALAVLPVGERHLPRAHDGRLQAPRAQLRQGPVSAPTATAVATRLSSRDPNTPSGPRTSASSTTCASRKKTTLRRSHRADARARPARSSSGRCATSRCGCSTASRSRSSAPTAPARARSSRSWPGSSGRPRASSTSRGHVSGPADPRRRLRQGAERHRQHPARRRVPRPRRRGHPRAAALDHRVRRARRVHRCAAQDLLVGDARPARVRDRDLGRPGHPAARRGPRDRRRGVPREVEGPRHRASSRRPRPWSSSPTT